MMEEINEQTRQFIAAHALDDVHVLSLQAARHPGVNMPLAVRQITGRQKMRHKVPAFYASEEVRYPVRLSLEQASSELTARYKAEVCGTGQTVADLTGGMGIDCFFLARHFAQAAYVERQEELCDLARHNFAALDARHITVINTSAEEYIERMTGRADCLFIDPARRSEGGRKLVLLSDCEPDVSRLAPTLIARARRVLIKLSPMLDLSSALHQLPGVCQAHIVAVDNECKEVLLVLEYDAPAEPVIHAVHLTHQGTRHTFSYTAAEEAAAVPRHTATPHRYLYEPNAALLKSGAFRLIATRFDLDKLHPNTHLYTSDRLVTDFPGRAFEVTADWGNSRKEWKRHLAGIRHANVAVRNHPLSAGDLKKDMRLQDGGDLYLFACTLADGRKTVLSCRKASLPA